MITLSKKIKEERDKKEKVKSTSGSPKISRISVRDKLLVKGRLIYFIRHRSLLLLNQIYEFKKLICPGYYLALEA